MLIPLLLAMAAAPDVDTARDTGISGVWLLANLCYAGMKAQGHPSGFWRVVSFVFGFPGTLVSWLAITEGSERAYGVELPKKR